MAIKKITKSKKAVTPQPRKVMVDPLKERIVDINKELAKNSALFSIKFKIDNLGGDVDDEIRYFEIRDRRKDVEPVTIPVSKVKKPLGSG